MLSKSLKVDLADLEYKHLNVDEFSQFDTVAAQAVVAVTGITNLPVYYAFGNGNAGTTCDKMVELLFPAVSEKVSVDNLNGNILRGNLTGTAQWPAYIIGGLGQWVETSTELNETMKSLNITIAQSRYGGKKDGWIKNFLSPQYGASIASTCHKCPHWSGCTHGIYSGST